MGTKVEQHNPEKNVKSQKCRFRFIFSYLRIVMHILQCPGKGCWTLVHETVSHLIPPLHFHSFFHVNLSFYLQVPHPRCASTPVFMTCTLKIMNFSYQFKRNESLNCKHAFVHVAPLVQRKLGDVRLNELGIWLAARTPVSPGEIVTMLKQGLFLIQHNIT